MERSQLVYAIEVARQGNFTRAAEKLHISQPSLSNQIMNLERELGVSLFERTRRHVAVTEAGMAFVTEAERIVNGLDSLGSLMGEYAARRAGHLRLGALATMCSLKIPQMVAGFAARHEGARVTMLEEGSAALIDALARDEVDAVFAVMGPAELDRELAGEGSALRLFSSDVYVAVPKDGPYVTMPAFTVAELARAPLVSSTDDFMLQASVMASGGVEGIEPTYRCSQIDSCLSLVNEGMGVTLTTRITSTYHSYPNIRLVPLSPVLTRDIFLVWRKNPSYHPLLAVFIDWVREFYGLV